jgi:hypothetical protein
MQSTATKLRIKFNKVRRDTRWKKPNARFILISRDLREPTAVPWQPLIETCYQDYADFMKRGWHKGHVYVFPIRGRQPGVVYDQLMDRLAPEQSPEEDLDTDLLGLDALHPFASTGGELRSRKQMLSTQVKAPVEILNADGTKGVIVRQVTPSLDEEMARLNASLSIKGPTRE